MDKEQENSQAKLPAKRGLTEKEKQRRVRRTLQKEKELRFNEEKLQNIYTDKSRADVFN